MSDDELNGKKKKRKVAKNEFIDDEAELSGDDEVSEDEDDLSDDDAIDLDLVDKEAPELDTDEEEEEQLEDKEVGIGQRRRRKFRWQTKELMENSLGRHYDPDDDDSQEGDYDDDDDDVDYSELKPRLRRPTAESLLIGSTRITSRIEPAFSDSTSPLPSFGSSKTSGPIAGPSGTINDDSNSNTAISRPTASKTTSLGADMNRFVFRDKELVAALSTKETVIVTREEKNKIIQREIKRVQQSKSIFDQLYS